MNTSRVKNEGEVFTPDFIVRIMLDLAGYDGADIVGKHVMENSCGRGAFLCEIVERYIKAFLETSDDKNALKRHLETYVHGIEKDPDNHAACLENLNTVAGRHGLSGIGWDVVCDDALTAFVRHAGKMDFVVGNPPYVRVHNLAGAYDAVKKFSFAESGMTDLYLVFFETGLSMLSEKGRLCFITPGSFLASAAAAAFRAHIRMTKRLTALVDLEHTQPFDNATTYTVISLFDNARPAVGFDYYTYDDKTKKPRFEGKISYDAAFSDGKINIGTPAALRLLKKVDAHRAAVSEPSAAVKNGFATLSDKIFISDDVPDEMAIPVVKASTGRRTKCLFPYDANGVPLSETVVRRDFPKAYAYLSEHRDALTRRSIDDAKHWYLFGRSQALKDVKRNKVAVGQLIRDGEAPKINVAPAGTGVYGGLYVVSDKDAGTIAAALRSDDFTAYIKALKHYKSGGYYTFSSEELEKFLTYKLSD